MECTINIKVGKETILFKSLIDPDDAMMSIADYLSRNTDLKDKIISQLLDSMKPLKFGKKDLDSGSFVPNFNLESLKDKYTEITFGETGEYDVLLTRASSYKGNNFAGTIVKQNGRKVYIIPEYMIKRFAVYTRIMDQIRKLDISQEEFITTDLNSIKPKGMNALEFLVDFMENNDKYQNSLSTEKYYKITLYLNSLLSKANRTQGTMSDLAGAIKKCFFKSDGAYILNKSKFKEALLRSENVSEDTKDRIKNNSLVDADLKVLLNKFFLREAEWHLVNTNDSTIKATENYKTLDDRYSLGLNTIIDARPVSSHKGYNIYKFQVNGNDLFVASERFLNEFTPGLKGFNTLLQVIDDIDSKDDKREIYSIAGIDSTNFGILEVRLSKFYNNREILKIASYYRLGLTAAESTLHNYTMKTFRDRLYMFYTPDVASAIEKIINTPQMAYYFLKYTPTHKEVYDEFEKQLLSRDALALANDIEENLDYNYYIVISVDKYKSDYKTKLYRINESMIENILKQDITYSRGSIDMYFEAIKDVFSNKGLHVEIVNNPDSNAKAYLKNGIIYLNKAKASYLDAIHEYTHLFLQMVKLYNPELYTAIIDNFKSYLGLNIIDEYVLTYGDSDEVFEEILADLYSKYLSSGSASAKHASFFSKVGKSISEATGIPSLIWDSRTNDTIYDFMNRFFNYILESIDNIGITIPTDAVNVTAAYQYMEDNIKEVKDPKDTEFLSKICN